MTTIMDATIKAGIKLDLERATNAVATSQYRIAQYTGFVSEFEVSNPDIAEYYRFTADQEQARLTYFESRIPEILAELERYN